MSHSHKADDSVKPTLLDGRSPFTVMDPGGPGGPGTPLFLDQTEAQRAEKYVFGDWVPLLISGSGRPAPTPNLKVWI